MNQKEKKLLLLILVFLVITVSLAFSTRFFRAFEGPKEFFLALFAGILCLFWIICRLKYPFVISRRELLIPLVIWGAWAIISWSVNPDRVSGISAIVNLILTLLVFFAIVSMGDDTLGEKLQPYLLFTGAVAAVYSLMQHAGVDPVPWAQQELVRSRSISTLGNPNFLSSFLTMLIPVALVRAIKEKSAVGSIFLMLLWGLFCMVNIYTYSRTGLVAMILSTALTMALMGFETLRKNRIKLIGAFAVFLLAFGFVALLEKSGKTVHTLSQRTEAFMDHSENNVATRIGLWKAALVLTGRNPLLGTGPGNFDAKYLSVRHFEPMIVRNRVALPGSPHNIFLEISSFYGIPALLAYIAFLAFLAYLGWGFFFGKKEKPDIEKRLLMAGWGGGISAFYISHLAGFSTVPTDLLLWIFCGLFWTGTAGPSEIKTPPEGEKPSIPLSGKIIIFLVSAFVFSSLLHMTGSRTLSDYYGEVGDSYKKALGILSDPAKKAEVFKRSFNGFKNALQLNPTSYEYWLRLGKLTEEYSLSIKDPALALPLVKSSEKAYAMAISLKPEIPYAYADMARMLSRWGQKESALAFSQKSVRLDPYSPILVMDLAILYDSMGNTADAEKCFLKAIELYPIGVNGYGNLGIFYFKYGRMEEARQNFEKALKISPDDPKYTAYMNKIEQAMKEKSAPPEK